MEGRDCPSVAVFDSSSSGNMNGSCEPFFRRRPVRFGTVIRTSRFCVATLPEGTWRPRRSGWRQRFASSLALLSETNCAASQPKSRCKHATAGPLLAFSILAGPPRVRNALGMSLTTHGCSTEMKVDDATGYHGASSPFPRPKSPFEVRDDSIISIF